MFLNPVLKDLQLYFPPKQGGNARKGSITNRAEEEGQRIELKKSRGRWTICVDDFESVMNEVR
jgi:hypothetical protein